MALIVSMLVAAAGVATPQAAIDAAMADSAAGWNTGDLARFTAIYAPDAIYVAGDKVVRGKAAIAERYAKSFADGGNTRGRLTFQPLAWRPLSAVHVLHVARWTLTPAGGAAQTGLTTLLFERRKDGWKIISDHSS
ncbi:nuclear transport factor 2 family protein [uncultured Sphingomonas sp.]|uniref:YybH family protein n=1 Tax=uncultured Sphingomonas sp. TaxID=158754 RepID=UPI0025F89AA1|nr:nuclear transport factor 2 family protein [uncultured Sphingomonas sp.]